MPAHEPRRSVEELNSVATTVKPEEMKLAQQVIATFDGPLDLADYKDECREGLQRIIDAKIACEEIIAPAVEAPPRVVNLMGAEESLDAVSATKPANQPRSASARNATVRMAPSTVSASSVNQSSTVADRWTAHSP